MSAVLNYFGAVVPTSPTPKNLLVASSTGSSVINGHAGSNYVELTTAAQNFIGQGGGDTIIGVVSGDTITEPVSTAVNTISVNNNYIMPANVQDMIVTSASSGVIGNNLNDYIVSKVANITIQSGTGNDVLTGVAGDNYKFVANSGDDVITNFHPGASTTTGVHTDTVELAGYSQFQTFAQVEAAMTQVGSDVVLKLGSTGAIKFSNTTLSSFTAANFLLDNAPTNLALSFNGQFNSSFNAGPTSAGDIWSTDYGWGGNDTGTLARTISAQGEKELYVDPTLVSATTGKALGLNPFSVSNGVLTIHAAPAPAADVAGLSGYQYTSGMISTRDSFTQTYGYFQATMDVQAGGGAWPAFWLYSANGNKAEIDVMEATTADTITTTSHSYATGSNVSEQSSVYMPNLSSGFHTFGVLWTASTITWYVDGAAVRSEATPADMNGPMYMVADLALSSSTPSTFTGASLQISSIQAYSLANVPSSVTSLSGGNQTLTDAAGATTLYGNGVNDTFHVSNAQTQVIQQANGGNSTIYASVNYVLPANVQNLVLTGNATMGTGNSMNDTITGDALNDTLVGGATGNDTLIGGTANTVFKPGAGNDKLEGGSGTNSYVFTVNPGADIITNFNPAKDSINLTALKGESFTLHQNSLGAEIVFSSTSYIAFNGLTVAELVSDHIIHASTLTPHGADYIGVL